MADIEVHSIDFFNPVEKAKKIVKPVVKAVSWIGQELRNFREKHNLSRRDICLISGVSESAIYLIETGRTLWPRDKTEEDLIDAIEFYE